MENELTEEWSFQLSPEEFFFLTQLVGVRHIANFDDPYRGYLAKELEAEYKVIEKTFVEKGYLVPKQEGTGYDMNEMLAYCIAACGSADVMHVSKKIEGTGKYEGHYYFTPRIVVEQTADEIGGIVLVPVADAQLTLEAMKGFFPLTLQYKSPAKKAVIKDCTWDQWNQLTEVDQRNRLVQAGHTEEQAELALDIFSNGERSGSMMFMKRHGLMWHQEDYHYAQWGDKLYLAVELTEGTLQFQPYKPAILKKALLRFADQIEKLDGKGVK